MNSQSPLSVVALGWALAATFVAIFVICLALALIFPDWTTAQGWVAWIALFSSAPMTSARIWIEGVIFSIAFGWVSAVVFGLTYNHFARPKS